MYIGLDERRKYEGEIGHAAEIPKNLRFDLKIR